ncbi:homoserine acetyltransferase [Ramicandelaber brevisporus]|nr:homoserine acetyltransferase [Ramicandelaber brevisporus]
MQSSLAHTVRSRLATTTSATRHLAFGGQLQQRLPRLGSSLASRLFTSESANPPLSFPCVDKLAERTRQLVDTSGPEPAYDKIVSGYKVFEHSQPFYTDHGGALPSFKIAYETWGTLDPVKKDNAILVHTGLSASSHARSHELNTKPGWWEDFIGPGKALDTNEFFVICTNVLGGCYGSTGPSSIDPLSSSRDRYATRFPILTIGDMVRAQFHLLDSLGIQKLHASVGASMGGMQSLYAATMFPERVSRFISISAAARSHPYSIAMRHVQRQVLMTDPNWNKGFYYQQGQAPPHAGMKLAREIATISYRSGPEWELRFGRKRTDPDAAPAMCADFAIESYLDHQGERFCLQYDPNSLLYISKAMDMFDMSKSTQDALAAKRDARAVLGFNVSQTDSENAATAATAASCNVDSLSNKASSAPSRLAPSDEARRARHLEEELEDLIAGLATAQQPALVLGVQSDLLFPISQQREIAQALRRAGNNNVTFYELDAMFGHDTFLIDRVNVGAAVKGHLENF